MTEPHAGAGALDQPGNVSDHELALFGLQRPQHRLEGGERILGHLGMGAGQTRQQRGLAGVGKPHQAHIGEQLQLQIDPRFLAGQAAFGEARSLMGWTGEPLVAPPAGAAVGNHRPLAGADQVVAGPIGLDHRFGTRRHAQLERDPVGPVAQRSLPMTAPAGLVMQSPAKARQVAQRVVAHEHHVSATRSVAAVRTALGDMGLAAEAEAPVTPRTGLNVDPRAIVHPSNMADPVFLVTGASSGIGAATAREASRAGYRMVLAARSVDRLAELAEELGGDERAMTARCDVTEWSDQEAMVAATLERFGQLDVAFANAGFGASRGFLNESPEHWRSMVLTNVYGAALTIRATLPALKESRGHLLLTGSVAGRRALPGSLYSATKWAVTAMGESARQELQDTGVRVTVVEPGMVDTPFFDNPVSDALHPEDVARAVMFAVSQPPHVDVNEILIRPTAQTG
jgi:NADP-dependent 3-hydroxy acid dehydrogenase YdfG